MAITCNLFWGNPPCHRQCPAFERLNSIEFHLGFSRFETSGNFETTIHRPSSVDFPLHKLLKYPEGNTERFQHQRHFTRGHRWSPKLCTMVMLNLIRPTARHSGRGWLLETELLVAETRPKNSIRLSDLHYSHPAVPKKIGTANPHSQESEESHFHHWLVVWNIFYFPIYWE